VLLRRKSTPPAEIASALDLRRGERVLASARGFTGEWYLGSNLALHLPATDGRYRRLPWEEVERADWQREADRLAIVEVTDEEPSGRTTYVRIDDAGHLLELLRERVTKSVVCSLYSRVYGSAGLSVVGRRSPSGEGPVTWSYVLSPGLDARDPLVVHVAEATLDRAERELEGL